MRHIKTIVITIAICIFLLQAVSCKKKEQATVTYQNRVAQDTNYRIGKWYSILPWTNQSINPALDTIWFINDTLAGWTGRGGNPYVFYKTYFPDFYHIAIITPAVSWQPPGTINTTISECGMTATGDTFAIYTKNGYMITKQQYVKKTN